ncbi:MAG: hypothetical protein KDI88_15575 [Gammaproteobacteria bacterium]|nr:hypothetical protein [Gammaproteobacteria bacterium]
MNVTPALPNPVPQPDAQQRQAVGAVRAPNRSRDAADETDQKEPPRRVTQVEREELIETASVLHRQDEAGSRRARKALAAYADVADAPDRASLRDLLGFDAYA